MALSAGNDIRFGIYLRCVELSYESIDDEDEGGISRKQDRIECQFIWFRRQHKQQHTMAYIRAWTQSLQYITVIHLDLVYRSLRPSYLSIYLINCHLCTFSRTTFAHPIQWLLLSLPQTILYIECSSLYSIVVFILMC